MAPVFTYWPTLEPLVAIILGGDLVASVGSPITFDASSSYDPTPIASSTYAFSWSVCGWEARDLTNPANCLSTAAGINAYFGALLSSYSSKVTILPLPIGAGQQFGVTFTISDPSTYRSTSFTAVVRIVNTPVPLISIVALDMPVATRHNADEQLVIRATLFDSYTLLPIPADTFMYYWTTQPDVTNLEAISVAGIDRTDLGIIANALTLTQYIFTLHVATQQAQINGIDTALGSILVLINQPPAILVCSTCPPPMTVVVSSIAGQATLLFNNKAFLDEDLPLSYRFSLLYGGEEFPIVVEASGALWSAADPPPSAYTYNLPLLPFLDANLYGHYVKFRLYVSDVYGATTVNDTQAIFIAQTAVSPALTLDYVLKDRKSVV